MRRVGHAGWWGGVRGESGKGASVRGRWGTNPVADRVQVLRRHEIQCGRFRCDRVSGSRIRKVHLIKIYMMRDNYSADLKIKVPVAFVF